MPTTAELINLLYFPSESLAIEYKSWLDLTANPGRAILAKAAIALANEGGGIIVLGMREEGADGRALASQPRPPIIARYSQDDINAAINRFADPEFHCDLVFVEYPETGVEHAFVIVPGGMAVPVMSSRGCDGVITARRCYVRKPGPRSEEPNTAEEWRPVLERCLHARREGMLDAIRIIVQGHGGPAPTVAAQNELLTYMETSRARWQQLIVELPIDDSARMPRGHYEMGFELLGVPVASGLTDLREKLAAAGQIKHTGRGPFVALTREPLDPRPVNGNIEAWVGHPGVERARRDPAHCDFWRAHPSGRLFLLRGYDEDSDDRVPPGTILDAILPIWRLGEAMLYVSRLARQYVDNDPPVLIQCRYSGLTGRRLDCLQPGRRFSFARICRDDVADLQIQATARQIEENLVEVLHPLLVPLYERFAFFALPLDLVRQEIEQMRKNRF